MDKLLAFTNAIAAQLPSGGGGRLDGGGGGRGAEELRLLEEMFRGADFSRSVLTTVLDEHQGRLDAAIDTLLNLANDPLLEDQPPRQAALPTTTTTMTTAKAAAVSAELAAAEGAPGVVLRDDDADEEDDDGGVVADAREGSAVVEKELSSRGADVDDARKTAARQERQQTTTASEMPNMKATGEKDAVAALAAMKAAVTPSAPAHNSQSSHGNKYLNHILSELALEDARLLEEMLQLETDTNIDARRQPDSRTAEATTPPLQKPLAEPVSVEVPVPAVSVPLALPGVLPNIAKEEVLSVLQTIALFPPESERPVSSDDIQPSSLFAPPTTDSGNVSGENEMPSSVRKLVCPTSARAGDVVGVSWDLGPDVEPSPGDWIGLFKQNQPSNTQYVVYKKTGGAKRGILDVAAPGLGTWEFRFFPNNSYEYIMKSNLLIVGPQLELVASLDEEGTTVQVSCNLISGQSTSRDWVGLYKVDTYHNKEYLDMRYVNNISETLTFPAPKTPGHYELRYFPAASSYNDVARSNLVTVEDRDMVIATPSRVIQGSDEQLIATWQIRSVPTSTWDWVGLYPVGSQTYIEYHYIDPSQPRCTFAVPKQPGQYEIKYFASATSSFLPLTQQRRSTKVTVLPSSALLRATV